MILDNAEAPELDSTPVTITLPTYVAKTLRGAARRTASSARHASARREHCLTGRDLDLVRAQALDQAVVALERALTPIRP